MSEDPRKSKGQCGVASCPCNDGDPCNYEDHEDTKAMPLPPGPDEPQDQDYYVGWQ